MPNVKKDTTEKKTIEQEKPIEEKVSIEAVIVDKVEVVKKVTPINKPPRKYAQDDLILCRSVTGGELLLPSRKTGMLYIWSNYGDTCEVEFQDLQGLKSTRSPYLRQPLFIIEDDELVEQWSKDLMPIYAKFTGVEDIDTFFDLPLETFKTKVAEVPIGIQNAIKVFAVEKIHNGTLDSLKKVNAIDEILGTDLKSYLM